MNKELFIKELKGKTKEEIINLYFTILNNIESAVNDSKIIEEELKILKLSIPTASEYKNDLLLNQQAIEDGKELTKAIEEYANINGIILVKPQQNQKRLAYKNI